MYMHEKGFIHRDLKPDNILYFAGDDSLKLADFGTAKKMKHKPPYTYYVSTRWYRAPECILKMPDYNEKSDVWALGVIMAEFYKLKPVFAG